MTSNEQLLKGKRIHKQMEERLNTDPVKVCIEGETELYKTVLEYSQPDYIWNGRGYYLKTKSDWN